MASDEEIAGRADLADTPLGGTPRARTHASACSAAGSQAGINGAGSSHLASGTSPSAAGSRASGLTPSALAEAVWELLPAAAGSGATPRAAAAEGDEQQLLQPAAAPAGDAPKSSAAGSREPPWPEGPSRLPAAAAPGLAARLGCLLRRLLAAAGASGSSVSQQTVAHNLPLSHSPSLESLYATPHGSSGSLLEEACSEPDELQAPQQQLA